MNKRTKKRAWNIFGLMGKSKKEDRDNMTEKDWQQFNATYQEKYGISFEEDLAAPDDSSDEGSAPGSQGASPEATLSPELQAQVLEALNDAAEATGSSAPESAPETVGEAMKGMITAMNTVATGFRELAKQPESSNPVEIVRANGNNMSPDAFSRFMGYTESTETYLFGIEEPFFARGNWWSEIVVTGKGKEKYTTADAKGFAEKFKEYAEAFSDRCSQLAKSNQVNLLDYNKIVHGESYVDYSRIDAKFGEYSVRRMDAIIAYLRTLKSVSHIFPVVSNIQNEAKAPTAFFEELSQSYKSGYIAKGSVNFDGEVYRVADVMFKFWFEDPKALEKAYIGYYNREGSHPMKWHLFEWCIVHFGTILFNEQQRRRVIGVVVPRQGDFPQPAMFSADGGLRAIQRVEEELKILPFKDLKLYDEVTILEYVRKFWAYVTMILPSMNNMRLYVNEKHQLWYVDAYDAKYSKNNDYSGPNSKIRYYSPDDIIWVPNMDANDYKMWISVPGNVENYEDKPNEMYGNFYFEQHMEQLWIASWWKEGAGVLAPGVQFDTLENLEKSKRKMQWLFTNYPVVPLDPDATVIDGELCYEFETGENTATTAITDIENVSTERVYKIICGSLTNKTTIAKSGNFSEITAAWNPTAVGDYLKVYAQLEEQTVTIGGKQKKIVVPTGKFLELGRKVS